MSKSEIDYHREQCIGYECYRCKKQLSERERQQLIALGFWQTWCLMCAAERMPDNKMLHDFIVSNGENDTIIDVRNLKLGNAPPPKDEIYGFAKEDSGFDKTRPLYVFKVKRK